MMADNNWNQNDELRALASLITHISADIRIKKMAIAPQSRISFWNIVEKNHSPEEKGFDIEFAFHSSMLIAA